MSTSHGQFVWCELMTTDPASAIAFYGAVIGWSAKEADVPDLHYMILSAGEVPVGGVMELCLSARDAGARPGWIGHIAVDDVDAVVARACDAGGAIRHAAEDIPGIGRFAVVSDPQGAVFVLFKPLEARQRPRAAANTPGHLGWRELNAADREAAFTFYADLFGWTKADAIDMGEKGLYQMFAIGGVPAGGIMTAGEAKPGPFWLYYFNVDDIGAAVARVKESGGQVVNGPHQVPGGSWIAHCLDPQGVPFAVVAPDR